MFIEVGALLALFLVFCAVVIALAYVCVQLFLWVRRPYRADAYRPLTGRNGAPPSGPFFARRTSHIVLSIALPVLVPLFLIALASLGGSPHPSVFIAAPFVGLLSGVPSLLIAAPRDQPLRMTVLVAYAPAVLLVLWMAASVFAVVVLSQL